MPYQCNIPVSFFIFNRPDATRKVFAEISKVKPTKLFVIADGPRRNNTFDEKNCKSVREIINNINWDCEVHTNFADENMGCKKRISSGLDWVFGQVENAIILEDDCLPTTSFFKFCELMLMKYAEDERVMMVGGANYMIGEINIQESYFFSRYFSIWGWATWKRAWNKYDIDMSEWPKFKKTNQINAYYEDLGMRRHLDRIFDMAANNKLDTWDIQWFYSCLFNSGLSINPAANLVTNIGIDGTHTKEREKTHLHARSEIDWDNFKHPSIVGSNYQIDNNIFRSILNKSRLKRVLNNVRFYLTKFRIYYGN